MHAHSPEKQHAYSLESGEGVVVGLSTTQMALDRSPH